MVDWYEFSLGEKLTAEEVDTLVQGMEDSNGMINYEGMWSQNLRTIANHHDISPFNVSLKIPYLVYFLLCSRCSKENAWKCNL